MDTHSDMEWRARRTGLEERHVASSGYLTSEVAVQAGIKVPRAAKHGRKIEFSCRVRTEQVRAVVEFHFQALSLSAGDVSDNFCDVQALGRGESRDEEEGHHKGKHESAHSVAESRFVCLALLRRGRG